MSGIPEDINVTINIRRRIGEYEHLDMTAETNLERGTPWEEVRAVRTKLALALDPSLAPAKPAEEPKAEKRAPGTVVVGPKPETAQEAKPAEEPKAEKRAPAKPETAQEAAKAWDEAEEMKAEEMKAEPAGAPELVEDPPEADKRARLRELVAEAATKKGHEPLLATMRPIAEKHGVIDGGELPIEAVEEAFAALSELLSR